MAGIPRPKLNRVPGGGMPLAKKENHIKDLQKLTHAELLEIKDREGMLLANKSKLNRLPDKGLRIQKFYEKVLQELNRRDNVDEAAAMFSELNIAEKGQNAINHLEWNRNISSMFESDPNEDVLDSDDETEMDPLRIIAQRSMHERKTKILPPEPVLITEEDLEEIKSFATDSPDSGLAQEATYDVGLPMDGGEKRTEKDSISSGSCCSTPTSGQKVMDQHVRYLVDMVEEQRQPYREKFKPYQTTISNVHDPEKEKQRKKGKHWEVTAATPPLIQHSAAQMINLLDSVEIQSNYLFKLKELQEKQAAERLAAKLERLQNRTMQLPSTATLKSNTAFTTYRNPTNHIEGDQRYNEAEDVHDPTDVEKPGGGVNYTVFE